MQPISTKLGNLYFGDCLEILKTLSDNSVDLLCTDPPYGYSFMGKDWDKAVPSVEVWKECLRVLKPGAFAFIMSAPRSDVLSRMIVRIEDAGFRVDFSPIYWTYASGFPKAMNIGKMVDKRGGVSVGWFGAWLRNWRKENNITQKEIAALFPSKTGRLTGCVANWELGLNIPTPEQFSKICRHFDLPFESIEAAEREVVGQKESGIGTAFGDGEWQSGKAQVVDITVAATEKAKALDGSYGGFQPKPAVEVVIVAMKPLSEKTFIDQALKNGKGITWLDDCRVPTAAKLSGGSGRVGGFAGKEQDNKGLSDYRVEGDERGRFPANILVSDDVLNDGRITKATASAANYESSNNDNATHITHNIKSGIHFGDTGSYSRYFDLDAWAKTLPFLIVPKASKGEKNEGLSHREAITVGDGRPVAIDNAFQRGKTERKNSHPTVKPLKLMSYLITLGSRPVDVVLDPFLGSGTTALAAANLNRKYIGIEREREYLEIAKSRLEAATKQLTLL